MMSKEQEFQKIAIIYRELENRLKILQEQLIFLENNRAGISMSTQAIEDLSKIEPDEEVEIMLPIGNSAFVKAKMEKHDNFVIAIGKDVFVEKNTEKALEWMNKLFENYDYLYKTILNQIKETSAQLEQIRPQMEMIYRQMNQTSSPNNPNSINS
jgi:prefoldin alpha subunit